MTIEKIVHDAMDKMTTGEKKAARALLANYPMAGLAPVSKFAEAAGTSAPTVLRFLARIGFSGYPEFQQVLRAEISESLKSPLEKSRPDMHAFTKGAGALRALFDRVAENLARTANDIPEAELERVCDLLADERTQCYLLGGRFTDSIAAYMASHLRVVRRGIRRFDGQVSTWNDQILDVRAGDVIIIFDIRRYQEDLLRIARELVRRKTRIILITDQWLSPVSRHAHVVLPCHIDVAQTWDSSAVLMALAEAIINQVTLRNWEQARARIENLEIHLREPTEHDKT